MEHFNGPGGCVVVVVGLLVVVVVVIWVVGLLVCSAVVVVVVEVVGVCEADTPDVGNGVAGVVSPDPSTTSDSWSTSSIVSRAISDAMAK